MNRFRKLSLLNTRKIHRRPARVRRFAQALAVLVPGTALALLVDNTPPLLGEVEPIITLEDQPVLGIPLRVADEESPPEALELRVSTPPRLAGVYLSGTGAERRLDLVPHPDAQGIEEFQLELRDPDGGVTTQWIPLKILPVNDPPVLGYVPNVELPAPPRVALSDTLHNIQSRVSFPVSVVDVDDHPSLLKYHAASSSPRIFASFSPNLVQVAALYGSSGHAARVTLRVSDGEFTVSRSFRAEVLPREELPQPLLVPDDALKPEIPQLLLDLDADGRADQWLAGAAGEQPGVVHLATPLRVSPPDASPTLQQEVSLPSGTRVLAWADFDGDGLLDLLLLREHRDLIPSQPAVELWRTARPADGSLQFQMRGLPAPTSGFTPHSALVADLDRDGDPDALLFGAIVDGRVSGQIRRLRNGGDAGFVVEPNPFEGLIGAFLPGALADFDGDGDADVFVRQITSQSGVRPARQVPWVYANDGNGNFLPLARGPELTNVVDAGAVDLDGDALPELWLLTSRRDAQLSDQEVWLLRRAGALLEVTGRLELPRHLPVPALVAWSDFNLDGRADLLTLAAIAVEDLPFIAALPRLYLNQGAGELVSFAGVAPPPGDLRPGLRLLATGFDRTDAPGFLKVTPAGVERWTNRLRADNFTLPFEPQDLRAWRVGEEVLFAWEPPNWTPGNARPTYNLRVGTRSGANDVVASQSLPDGRRLQAAAGNAGAATRFRLRLPRRPAARLYWSVQALDTAGRGGPFAEEQTLDLEPQKTQPPQIEPLADLILNEDETGEMSFVVGDDTTPPENLQVVALAVGEPFGLWSVSVHGPDATRNEPPGLRHLRVSPELNRWGAGLVKVVVFDREGRRAEQTFRVTVQPMTDYPVTQLNINLWGTHVGLSFRADPYTVWQYEASTNLVNWEPVPGGVVDLGSKFNHVFQVPRGEPHQFFRLRRLR